jgi:hypothetical protein
MHYLCLILVIDKVNLNLDVGLIVVIHMRGRY